ncbi:MAG: MBL fold metallo-hydrolase [Clostridiales bacterium]|nr:MBL fold metallo-hydrolase [Clostridiales bacterium]
MKIKYLGTAAAEGIPGVFCNCDVCMEARKRGGKNIRTRSQAIIDDKLLIDFPADTYMHCVLNGIDLTKVEHCLITHTHTDHLYVEDIEMRFAPYSNLGKDKPFKLYGLGGGMLKINGYINSKTFDNTGIVEVCPLDLYKPVQIDEYTVTAMEAIHDVHSYPAIYLIRNHENKTLLYGHDTHYFDEGVWKYIAENKVKLDFVSMDCTSANVEEMTYIGHMNLNDNIKVMNRLKEMGAADEHTVFCSNHFSHNGKDVLFEEFSVEAAKSGIITSYDGLEINF